jgi:predicted enzyme related to lactoylglutathione lyase
MKIKNIGLAWVTTADITKAKDFFANILELEVTADSQEHGWLEFKAADSSFLLGVGQVKPDDENSPVMPGYNAVVTFTVDDIVAAKKELEAKEVDIYDIVEVPGHVKMAFMQDPDGNVFQIVQMLEPKA